MSRLFTRALAKDGQSITIEDRSQGFLNGQSSELFTNPRDDIALICTVSGVTVFDSTNTERAATHKIKLSYRDDVTAESWVTFKGKRVKILSTENKCETDKILVLMCTERGDDSAVNRG